MFKIVIHNPVLKDIHFENDIVKHYPGIDLVRATEDAKLLSELENADAFCVNLFPVDKKLIDKMHSMKVISRYGIGYDTVDTDYAAEKGIAVANVPGYCRHEAAEHTIAMLLMAVRKIEDADKLIHEGMWQPKNEFGIQRLAGKKLGLIGYGDIAKLVHKKLSGFDLDISIFRAHPEKEAPLYEARYTTLDSMFLECDYILCLASLNEKTRGMIGYEHFSKMKENSVFVNTARGAIIDENAIIRALSEVKTRRAALDVFCVEPLPENHKLRELDNAILTNHSAWFSVESNMELRRRTLKNAIDVFEGKKPESVVNESLIDKSIFV